MMSSLFQEHLDLGSPVFRFEEYGIFTDQRHSNVIKSTTNTRGK